MAVPSLLGQVAFCAACQNLLLLELISVRKIQLSTLVRKLPCKSTYCVRKDHSMPIRAFGLESESDITKMRIRNLWRFLHLSKRIDVIKFMHSTKSCNFELKQYEP